MPSCPRSGPRLDVRLPMSEFTDCRWGAATLPGGPLIRRLPDLTAVLAKRISGGAGGDHLVVVGRDHDRASLSCSAGEQLDDLRTVVTLSLIHISEPTR